MTSALTPGDETGARAEVLSRVRRELAKVERGDVVSKSVEDMRCLLAELDRVTAERDEWRERAARIAQLEAQVHGNHDAIERGIRAHMILETRCAAMREALVHRGCEEGGAGCQVETPFNLCPTCEALASDAGKALLARLEKAESAVGSEAWNALKMRAQALEEAAKVVEEGVPCWGNTRLLDIAAAIRALKGEP